MNALGEPTTFFLFAVLCAITFIFASYLVPETKGRLEGIQQEWQHSPREAEPTA